MNFLASAAYNQTIENRMRIMFFHLCISYFHFSVVTFFCSFHIEIVTFFH